MLLLDELCDCLQLDIRCSFINSTLFRIVGIITDNLQKNTHNLGIPPELFNAGFTRETYATSPLDSLAADLLRYHASKILGHGGLLREALSLVSSPRCIICHQPGRFDVNSSLSNGKGHPLESPNWLAKLLPLICVWHTLVKRSLRESNHLRCDANPALVQDFDRDLLEWSAVDHSI